MEKKKKIPKVVVSPSEERVDFAAFMENVLSFKEDPKEENKLLKEVKKDESKS